MSWELEFFVPGIPRTQGSKRGFPYKDKKTGATRVAIVDDAGQKGKDWKTSVAFSAHDAMTKAKLDPLPKGTPISVDLVFYFPRPKKHYGTGKKIAVLRGDAPQFHTVKPDRVKIVRPVEDAMTSIVWNDDCQICNGQMTKKYCDEIQKQPGVRVVVRPCGRI